MIGFDLSEEQRMIRDTVAAFSRDEIRPAARAADETGAIDSALVAKSWELGLVCGAIPEEFGGFGDLRSAVTGAIVAEELAFGDLAVALHALAPRLLAYPVLEFGTPAQREAHLKGFGAGRFVPASAAVMEPFFDFDASAMRAAATSDGESYLLDGAKCCVPLAGVSDTLIVFAATDLNAGFGGVDGFILARTTPGLTVGEREKNMGVKGLATHEVTLENCRIGSEARLGGDKGCDFTRIIGESRVAMAAMAVGVARAAYEYARDYAKERRAFGGPIATKQAIAFMLAEMATEIDATRLLVWEAAAALDRGANALVESYQARNYAAQSALMVTDNAVQILGGHGYIREHPVEMFLRNARGFATFDGMALV